jgi:hypothetical protein
MNAMTTTTIPPAPVTTTVPVDHAACGPAVPPTDRPAAPPTDAPATPPRSVVAFRRFAVPVALAAAPVVLAVGMALHPQGTDDDEAFVHHLGHHLTRWMICHAIVTVGFFCVFLGAGALLRLARGRGAVLTQVAAAAMAIGGLGAILETVTHGVLAYALGADHRVDVHLSTQVQLHWFHTAWGQALEVGNGIALLSLILAGIALLRSRAVARWAAVLVLLAPVSILFGGGNPVGNVLSLVPLAVGFTAVARAAVRTAAPIA